MDEVVRHGLHDNVIATGIMVLWRCSSQHVLVAIKPTTSDGAHTVPVSGAELASSCCCCFFFFFCSRFMMSTTCSFDSED